MKNILVIADRPGGKNLALKRALKLAAPRGARITLVGFSYVDKGTEALVDASMSRRSVQSVITDKRRDELEKLVKSLGKNPCRFRVESVWSKDIAGWLSDYVKTHPAEIVIKSGARTESLLHTPTDWQLIQRCPASVMIVAAKSWKKKPVVLASLDLDTRVRSKRQLNDRIIQQAQTLAAELGSDVQCAWALEIPTLLKDMDLINPREYAADKRRKVKPEIEKLAAKHGLDIADFHIKSGEPGRAIPGIANKLKADVVVAGTVGRKGVRGKILGNTAEGILTRLYTDICVVKP